MFPVAKHTAGSLHHEVDMLTQKETAPLILLVEDDPGHAMAIQRSFQSVEEPYRIMVAGTLREAREMLYRTPPSVVLTDYRLPDGEGSELAPLAQERWPTILMTSKGSEQIAVQVMKSGIQDYVVKSAETFAHMPETINHALKAWALILARKEAEESLRSYARRLIEMEEDLRKKLASELHDEIGRDLTVLGMNFSIIRQLLGETIPEKVVNRIEDSSRLIQSISRTTRDIMSGLRPPVLDDYGLLAALRWHKDLFSNRTGLSVTLDAPDDLPRLLPDLETALFRIYQEALLNTAKYAKASTVTVTARLEDSRFIFTITDDGIGGVSPDSSPQQLSGWGMTIMRERAELVGGTFSVDSQPGCGTTVTIALPLKEV
jgi:signal transduction histidine kinase